MKRIFLFTAALSLVCLTGCIVTSVYPFCTAKDVEFDPALLGVWSDTNASKDSWTFQPSGARGYKLTVVDGEKKTEFDTYLFKLKGRRYLDACPVERPDEFVPPHYLLKVVRLQPQLELAPLNYKWLGELLAENPKAIRHLDIEAKPDGSSGSRLVLTASTPELQRFIIRHADNTNAFEGAIAMKRQ
jgi:hypothetical protein